MKTNEPFYEYFNGEGEALSLVERIINENKGYYSKIRARIVLVKSTRDGLWINGLCVFQAFPKAESPKPVSNLFYERFRFLEYWLEPEELESYFGELKTGIFKFNEETIQLRGCNRISRFEFKQGIHLKNSLYYFQADCQNRPDFASHEPIISAGLPVFPSAHSAIRYWTGVQNIDSNSSLFGSVMVFLPECRAWVSNLEYLEDGIEIEVQQRAEELRGLKIKGVWEENDRYHQFSELVKSEKIRIKAPEKSTGFNFYLLDDDENIFDFQQEISGWSYGQKNVLAFLGKKEADLKEEKVIKDALASGEGLQIEYKLFVKRGDLKKIEELVETTVAFLNSNGGRILVGVNDNCVVQGIEKEVMTGKEIGQRELEEYCGFIRQVIGGATEKPVEFSVTLHKCDGHWIVLINVSPGKEKPYQTKETLLFMVRRGASNRRATSEEIKTMVRQLEIKTKDSELDGIISAFE